MVDHGLNKWLIRYERVRPNPQKVLRKVFPHLLCELARRAHKIECLGSGFHVFKIVIFILINCQLP